MYKEIKDVKPVKELNSFGKEALSLTSLADFDATDPRIKLFSFVQVKPGEEVLYHMHIGESEHYFILSGKGLYNDNGNKVEVGPGYMTLTPSGEGHSIKNIGDEPLCFIALIVAE